MANSCELSKQKHCKTRWDWLLKTRSTLAITINSGSSSLRSQEYSSAKSEVFTDRSQLSRSIAKANYWSTQAALILKFFTSLRPAVMQRADLCGADRSATPIRFRKNGFA